MTDALAINLDAPCWLFQGRLDSNGYGLIPTGKRGPGHLAHRYMWTMMRGAIPEGKELDHLCRVPACVNPQHLEPVTHRENVLRGVGLTARNARKTHCDRGHLLDAANTHITQEGWRDCRLCRRLARRARYWANPEKFRQRKNEWSAAHRDEINRRQREARKASA
jgi:HNH endonuclease